MVRIDVDVQHLVVLARRLERYDVPCRSHFSCSLDGEASDMGADINHRFTPSNEEVSFIDSFVDNLSYGRCVEAVFGPQIQDRAIGQLRLVYREESLTQDSDILR